jgi:hypothetical protein
MGSPGAAPDPFVGDGAQSVDVPIELAQSAADLTQGDRGRPCRPVSAPAFPYAGCARVGRPPTRSPYACSRFTSDFTYN